MTDRLISADALKKMLNPKEWGTPDERWRPESEFAQLIDFAPTIEAEPVKHGKWRHYEGMITCSACGAEYYDDIMEYLGDDVPHCCPVCEARMDGGENG